jgi:hypothetical protein
LLGCRRSNSTTRPPRSPVARCSPLLSNSTAEIMSASHRVHAPSHHTRSRQNRRLTGSTRENCEVGGRGYGTGACDGAEWAGGAAAPPSCTSSPGVRSPNTWLKFQSSAPAGSLAPPAPAGSLAPPAPAGIPPSIPPIPPSTHTTTRPPPAPSQNAYIRPAARRMYKVAG